MFLSFEMKSLLEMSTVLPLLFCEKKTLNAAAVTAAAIKQALKVTLLKFKFYQKLQFETDELIVMYILLI